MGNCGLLKQCRTKPMNFQNDNSTRNVETGASKDLGDQLSCSARDLMRSPISDQGDHCMTWVRESPKLPSRIPVRSSPFRRSKLSKSASFIRSSSQSRIPVVTMRTKAGLEPGESGPSREFSNADFKRSLSQLNESGFVSDYSVTTSGHSQVASSVPGICDRPPGVQVCIERASPQLEFSMCSPRTQTALVSCRFESRHKALRKQLSDVSTRRPHSLSCESEILIQRIGSKRISDVMSCSAGSNTQETNFLSPRQSDGGGSVLQDVSHLKLMLLKLRRTLAQDLADQTNHDNQSRPPSSPVDTDVAMMTREELEQKYEKLVARNLHLEKLLQFRDQLISQLQSDRDLSDSSQSRNSYRSPPRGPTGINSGGPEKVTTSV